MDLDQVLHAVQEGAGGEVLEEDRDAVRAGERDGVEEHGEDGRGERRRDDTRHDQVVDGIDRHRLERVDLLGDPHGPELGGDRAAHSGDDDDAGEDRGELPRQTELHGRAHQRLRIEEPERVDELEREHHPGEESGQAHDEERPVGHELELVEEQPDPIRGPEDAEDRLAEEDGKLAEHLDGSAQRFRPRRRDFRGALGRLFRHGPDFYPEKAGRATFRHRAPGVPYTATRGTRVPMAQKISYGMVSQSPARSSAEMRSSP